MARALASVLDPGLLTVIVNVGDDTERYGVHVSADPDTVLYTLAGVEGEHGWGRSDDTTIVMDELAVHGLDTSFQLGDRDLALCLARTLMLSSGLPLSTITDRFATTLGVGGVRLIPASDDPIRTWVQTEASSWLEFQEYFVDRRHEDAVRALAFHGSVQARPAPGVLESIREADTVVIAPSNPPLSIWPILAVNGIEEAVRHHPCAVAVSPLFGGAPLKGPADSVMSGLGLSAGTEGILECYDGLIDTLFVDEGDAADISLGEPRGVRVVARDTHLGGEDGGSGLALAIIGAPGD